MNESEIYGQRRLWTWDGLDENERTMHVIKGHVEVNDDVEEETMRYLREVWTDIQRNRVNVLPNVFRK